MAAILESSAKNASKIASDEYVFDETEFPALDAKPLADRRNKKGRRNAGEAFIQRQLATKAYVTKTVVADEGVGKKRRTRLLSSQLEDFGENVQYSLNRKARWETVDAAGCVRAAHPDEQVEVTAVNSYFSADGITDKYVKNIYRLEADDSISMRQARACKGANGKSLMRAACAFSPEDASDSPPKLHVQYVVAKAHPITKCLIAKFPKNRRPIKAIRRAVMDVSTYSNLDDDCDLPVADESHYRPRENTYTLADFIQENRENSRSIVFIRNKSTDSFEHQSMESIDTIDDDEEPSKNADVQVDLPSNSLLDVFELRLANFGITSSEKWQSQCESLGGSSRWLSEAKSHFFVDLTRELTQQAEPRKPLLCVILQRMRNDKLKVFVNTALKCNKDVERIRMEIVGRCRNTLSSLVQAILKTCEPFAKSAIAIATQPKHCIHSKSMSKALEPLSDYQILEKCAPSSKGLSGADQAVPELDADHMLEDDFEHVEMDDILLLEDDGTTASSLYTKKELAAVHENVCGECGDIDSDQLLHLGNCGHVLCVKCLTSRFHAQLSCKRVPFVCLKDNCDHPIPTDLLLALLPLPTVAFYSRLLLVQKATSQGKFVTECPNDHELIISDDIGDFGQVNCARCGTHWCLGCKGEPHWPLTCAQLSVWSKLAVGEKRANSLRAISAQAKNARLDEEAAQKVAKMMRKLTSYRVERRFVDARKTALQLIEFGHGWLHLTGADNASVAALLKPTLTELRDRVENLDNEVLYSQGTGVDTAKIVEKVDRIEALTEKATAVILKD